MRRARPPDRRTPRLQRETIRQLDLMPLTAEDLTRVAGGGFQGDCKSCRCTDY
jgi:hypothetical protein